MIWKVGGEIRRLPASIETPAVATLYITICYSASHSYKRTLHDLFKLAAK
jgi:hypothetical protein